MKPYMQLYQHYKGRLYTLLYIGTHTETEELFVVYTGAIDSSGKVHIRPYDMFFGEVEIDGKMIPRFERR